MSYDGGVWDDGYWDDEGPVGSPTNVIVGASATTVVLGTTGKTTAEIT